MSDPEVERAILLTRRAAELASDTGLSLDEARRSIQNALHREPNRWSAFTDEELDDLAYGVSLDHASHVSSERTLDTHLVDEINSELDRRRAS